MVLAVVVLIELEDRFACSLTEPDDCIDLTLAVPFYLPDYPRGANAGQLGRRGEVDVEHGVGMLLQVGGGDVRIGLTLDGAFDDRRFVLTRCDKRNFTRLHDR